MHDFCPLCMKKGVKKKLKALQVNLQEAVWMCQSENCVWPFGYEDFVYQPRTVGNIWSCYWDNYRPPTTDAKERVSVSMELSLYTPPVTPRGDWTVSNDTEKAILEADKSNKIDSHSRSVNLRNEAETNLNVLEGVRRSKGSRTYSCADPCNAADSRYSINSTRYESRGESNGTSVFVECTRTTDSLAIDVDDGSARAENREAGPLSRLCDNLDRLSNRPLGSNSKLYKKFSFSGLKKKMKLVDDTEIKSSPIERRLLSIGESDSAARSENNDLKSSTVPSNFQDSSNLDVSTSIERFIDDLLEGGDVCNIVEDIDDDWMTSLLS